MNLVTLFLHVFRVCFVSLIGFMITTYCLCCVCTSGFSNNFVHRTTEMNPEAGSDNREAFSSCNLYVSTRCCQSWSCS